MRLMRLLLVFVNMFAVIVLFSSFSCCTLPKKTEAVDAGSQRLSETSSSPKCVPVYVPKDTDVSDFPFLACYVDSSDKSLKCIPIKDFLDAYNAEIQKKGI